MRMPTFLARLRAIALCACVALAAAGCSRAQLFHQEAYVFGTRVDLTIYGGSQADATKAMNAVLREFDRLHRAYHAWEPSELTALNASIEKREPAVVSEELATMLTDAQELAATGDELFEPALGALIELWGFHSEEFVPKRPEEEAIRAILAERPRMSDLVIKGNRVESRNPAVQLDLGGYAKGYALDRAEHILREMGVTNALVNIGGNVIALGSKGDSPWRLGIQHPREPRPLATLPLYDGEAIGTSGDYQRYFELDGERYTHLIDPRTGFPANETQSLTVLVSPRSETGDEALPEVKEKLPGTLSDAASKPAFIAGDKWDEYVKRYGIEHALRVTEDGRIEVTKAMRARLQFPSNSPPVTVVE